MHVCIYVCIHVCNLYICACTCVYVCMCMCVSHVSLLCMRCAAVKYDVFGWVGLHWVLLLCFIELNRILLAARTCACVIVSVCAHVCGSINIYRTHTHICIYMYLEIHICIYIHICACVCCIVYIQRRERERERDIYIYIYIQIHGQRAFLRACLHR